MGTEEQIIEPLEGSTRLTGESLEEHCRLQEEEIQSLRESESRHKLQFDESQRRERILIRRLALKEQEIQDYVAQIAELKTAQLPTAASLRSTLLDPAVNIIIQKFKNELQSTKARLEETQNELSAWKFTPDSNTGKRLMAKCRLLYQENEELGKMTSNGRLAKLEGDLALQKSFSEEVKKSQSELDDFLQELDEDVEGMQSTILFLQQELKTSKDAIISLERENSLLKSGCNSSTMNTAETTATTLSISSTAKNNSTSNCVDMKDDNINALLNGTVNCSVVLSEKDVRINSERILRKEKLNSNSSLKNETRTLRSSTRNVVTSDDVRTTKLRSGVSSIPSSVSATNAPENSGNASNKCNGSSTEQISLNDCAVGNTDATSTTTVMSHNNGLGTNFICLGNNTLGSSVGVGGNCNNENKRNYDDDSDSSECNSPNTETTTTTTTSVTTLINEKQLTRTKKLRRSSVLSLDLNEEDSQIEIDDDRTILPTNSNGNGNSSGGAGGGGGVGGGGGSHVSAEII